MRKVTQNHGEYLPSAKLYLDDVQRVVEILRQASENVALHAEDYALDSWEELPELKKECIRRLSIKSISPFISLDIRPSEIWLYIGEDTLISRGLFEQIKKVVLARRRPFTWLWHNPILCVLFGAILSGGFIASIFIFAKSTPHIAYYLFSLVIFAAWFGYGFYDRFYFFSAVVPKYRVDSPGFLKRNRDKILLALISALIGAAIAYIVK